MANNQIIQNLKSQLVFSVVINYFHLSNDNTLHH